MGNYVTFDDILANEESKVGTIINSPTKYVTFDDILAGEKDEDREDAPWYEAKEG
mgnify:FL=1